MGALLGIIIGIALVVGVGATAVFIGACLLIAKVMDYVRGTAPRGGPSDARAPMQAPRGGGHRADPDPYASFQRRDH